MNFAEEAFINSCTNRLIVSLGIKSFGFSKIELLVQEHKMTVKIKKAVFFILSVKSKTNNRSFPRNKNAGKA